MNVHFARLALLASFIVFGRGRALLAAEPGCDLDAIADLGPCTRELLDVLRRPTAVDFQKTPLNRAFAVLAAQHRLAITFDKEVAADDVLTVGHVTLKVANLSLASVLNLIGRPFDLEWSPRRFGVEIVRRADMEHRLVRQVYPVAPLLRAMNSRRFGSPQLAEIVTNVASPVCWEETGGLSSAEATGGKLIIRADHHAHRSVARFVRKLERVYGLRSTDTPFQRAEKAIHKALNSEVSIEFHDQPLALVCDRLSALFQIAIVIDTLALADAGVDPNTRVTGRFERVSLRSALKSLLQDLDLTWVIHDEVLDITPTFEAERMPTVELFRVDDLAASVRRPGVASVFDLANLLTSLVKPESWDQSGGPGILYILPGVLVVAQTEDVLAELGELLAKLRAAPRGDVSPGTVGLPSVLGSQRSRSESDLLGLSVLRLKRALSQPAEVELTNAPLESALAQLSATHQVPIGLDRNALAEAGLGGQARVSLSASGLSLASILGLLTGTLDLNWTIDAERILVTTTTGTESKLDLEIYPVADLVRAAGDGRFGLRQLSELIVGTVEPWSWSETGGYAVIHAFGEMFVVAADRQVQEQTSRLLDDLRRAYGLRPRHPHTSAWPTRIRRAMGASVSIELRQAALVDVLKAFSRQSGVPIVLDVVNLADAGKRQVVMRAAAFHQTRLRSALTRILEPLELTWTVQHDAVFVTTRDAATRIPMLKVYAVEGLADPGGLARSRLLAARLSATVEPGSWEARGGAGVIHAAPNVLVVSQTREVIEAIDRWFGKNGHQTFRPASR